LRDLQSDIYIYYYEDYNEGDDDDDKQDYDGDDEDDDEGDENNYLDCGDDSKKCYCLLTFIEQPTIIN
jgi:hypothetical protein